jgi:hypothetical protein
MEQAEKMAVIISGQPELDIWGNVNGLAQAQRNCSKCRKSLININNNMMI